MDIEIIQIYMKIPSFGEKHIPHALHDVLDVCDAPKRVRVKRKSKDVEV